MRILDAFSGEGGAGEGYRRAGWEVVGIDNDPARVKNYRAGEAELVDDAVQFILDHGHEFDAIHASPPCTGYSRGTVMLDDRETRYSRLIEATRAAITWNGENIPYVIENVEGAKSELVTPMTLCWTMFRVPGSVIDLDGTPLWMRRHRLFESNVWMNPPNVCGHPERMQCAGAYGGARRDKDEARYERQGGYVPHVTVMRELLGTPWMTEKGCQLSIPPDYTHWIGLLLAEAVS